MKHPEMLNKKKVSVWNSVILIVCAVLICVILFDFWFLQKYIVVEVSGGSMETTLYDGDVLYADRYVKPERGDIVIIDVSPYREQAGFRGDYIIKRIIAMEGDTIKCEAHVVFLRKAGESDFLSLDEPYVNFRTDNFEEVTVGKDEIFFLGDHRNNSTDSRVEAVGCLKLSDVVGVVPKWSVEYKRIINAWETFRSVFKRGIQTEN